MTAPLLSIVVPALDEQDNIVAALGALQGARGAGAEIIVVDGGSRDATRSLAAPLADRVIEAPRGRARQMNAGAAIARAPILLFLHADTRLPSRALQIITAGLAKGVHRWGRFDVRIESRHRVLRIVACAMNLRSRWSGIATGDQAIFVERDLFHAIGGYPDIPLMEDVALTRHLRTLSPALCVRDPATTSGRRWERHGILRTIALMWRLRLAYALGADPQRLARRYEVERTSS